MLRKPTLVHLAVFTVATLAAFGATVRCSSSPQCAASNCNGCCDSSGQCQTGTGTQACGTGGNVCTACGSGQSCQNGACVAGSNDAGSTDSGTPADAGPCGNDAITLAPFDAGGIACVTDGGPYVSIAQLRAALNGSCP